MPAPLRRLCAASLLLVAASFPATLAAQAPLLPGQQGAGPVIQAGGPTFQVDNPTFTIPASHDFKALFVVDAGGGDTTRVNMQVTTMARYFNIHGRHGFPEKQVHTAAVFHNNGWPAVLNDSAYTARFGKPNPSRRLVEELLQHGATLVLCGQTAGRAQVKREELLPGVKVAISAMSAFEVLQSQGYHYIAW